jgi:hypothetical protein
MTRVQCTGAVIPLRLAMAIVAAMVLFVMAAVVPPSYTALAADEKMPIFGTVAKSLASNGTRSIFNATS